MIGFPERFSNIPGRETLARSQVLQRSWPVVLDLCVAGIGLACFYAVVVIAKYWFGHPEPEIVISQSPRALPLYAFYSVVRIGLAYLLSLVFAIGYGYVAAYNKRIEALMIAGLDILQSIPVLSFLPGVMLAMVALFPTRQIGVEMGAIVLIFTGQVWNMAFSFYSSIKSIPRELSRGCQHLSLFATAAACPVGASVFGDWAGVELDGLGGGRMVLPDGVRDVCSGDAGLPAAGAGLVPADGGWNGKLHGDYVGTVDDDCDYRCDGSADLAAGDRVERQVQV